MSAGTEGVVHYDVTTLALVEALRGVPLTSAMTREALVKMADALLGQMPSVETVTEERARGDYEVTLATLRNISERTLASPAGTESSRGYRRAMQDVKAVLDKHGAPADEPVHFGAQP